MKTRNFFITGLPRCRTAWFANLFTTTYTFCYHEWFATGDLRDIQSMNDIDRHYVGNSDGTVPIFWPIIKKTFGNVPCVIIDRDPEDSINAVLAAFSDAQGDKVRPMVYAIKEMIDLMRDEDSVISVPFESLGDTDTIARIWRHCLDNIEVDEERVNLLQRLKVAVKYKTFEEYRRELCMH